MSRILLHDALFADEPVRVESEALGCTLLLRPLTQRVGEELERRGVHLDLGAAASPSQSLAASRALLEVLLHGWEGLTTASGAEVPFTSENRDRLAELGPVVAEVMRLASELGVKVEEDEAGNSGS